MFASGVFQIGAHIIFVCLANIDMDAVALPVIGYIFYGISYCLVSSSLNPMLPYAVDGKVYGTAFGMLYVAESVGVVVVPIIIGLLQRNFKEDGVINYHIVSIYWLIQIGLLFLHC